MTEWPKTVYAFPWKLLCFRIQFFWDMKMAHLLIDFWLLVGNAFFRNFGTRLFTDAEEGNTHAHRREKMKTRTSMH
jgi:hypothetical protein